MAIISLSDMQGFIDDHATEDDLDLQGVVDAVNDWVGNYCKRIFDSTAVTEYYNGNGTAMLHLDNFPVTDLTRLAVGRQAAIYISNTNTSSTASATVNSTGLVLTYNGTASSLLFADYATLTLLVAAINALSGWAAELADADLGAYLSTELCPAYGKSCINSREVSLEIPADAEWDFDIEPNTGVITRPSAFPAGSRNIRVDYTAGYSEADMPEDLRLAAKIVCKDWYEKRSEGSYGLTGWAVGGMKKQIGDYIPREALRILHAYRRFQW